MVKTCFLLFLNNSIIKHFLGFDHFYLFIKFFYQSPHFGNTIKIDNVKKVEDLFLKVLNAFYMKGYCSTCLSPTEQFLEDVWNLQFLGMEEKMNQDFYFSLEEAKKSSLEERLILGLPITREEHQKIKTLGIRNLYKNNTF